MQIERIVIFYKRSTLDISKASKKAIARDKVIQKAITNAHKDHYKSVQLLKKQLADCPYPVKVHQRGIGRLPKIKSTDLLISLGGDGTFIYTSHFVSDNLLLGINSAPDSSVGFYCPVNLYARDFDLVGLIERIATGKKKPTVVHRIQVKVNKKTVGVPVLNDILLTETNPAITSRYRLQHGRKIESHKSSGIWISTATGSTAAYSSAGGKKFRQFNKTRKRQFGFRVRELYKEKGNSIIGGLVSEEEKFQITWAMPGGAIYFDGGYTSVPLKMSDLIEIEFHKHPLVTFL